MYRYNLLTLQKNDNLSENRKAGGLKWMEEDIIQTLLKHTTHV